MKEHIAEFGPGNGLQGIVTLPDSLEPGNNDKPAFILLNSGLLHRVGPFRAYVQLARELASQGFIGLRVDLSGKGDSLPRRGGKSLKENVLADVQDAIDYLQKKHGVKTVVLCGICTGADNTYQCAIEDERVVGIIPIDGYAYRTIGYYARYYWPKLFDAERWQSFSLGLLRRAKTKSSEVLGTSTQPEVDYKMLFPPRNEFKKSLTDLLGRNVSIFIIYSGGWAVNYKNQFKDAFPGLAKKPGIKFEYIEKADHTYSISSDRNHLISSICAWAKQVFAEN